MSRQNPFALSRSAPLSTFLTHVGFWDGDSTAETFQPEEPLRERSMLFTLSSSVLACNGNWEAKRPFKDIRSQKSLRIKREQSELHTKELGQGHAISALLLHA